ncbi:MAG: glycosyltransferase family 2 protein [Halobacteriota archaeon]
MKKSVSNVSSRNTEDVQDRVTRHIRSGDAISVLIPTKNRPQAVLECIRSVKDQSVQPAEIVIVDASDKDGLEALVCDNTGEKIKVEYVRSKAGLTRQKNIGVRKCSGDVVLVLDDDTILAENYIEEILNVFNNPSFDRVGCVYGDRVPPNDKNNAGRRGTSPYSIARAVNARVEGLIRTLFFLQKESSTGNFRLSGWLTNVSPSKPGATIGVTEGAPGGYTACYKEILNELRFDENLKGYASGEDADLSYRVSRKYQNIFNPKAKVIHNSLTPKQFSYAHTKMKIEYHHYLFKKNFPQALRNRFAFNMSVFGLFLLELKWAIPHRNWQSLRGYLDGVRAAHRNTTHS